MASRPTAALDRPGGGGDGLLETPSPPGRSPRSGWRTTLARLDLRWSPYLLIAPFFVLFLIFGLYPLVYTFWVSLHDRDLLGGESPFIGLENYGDLLGDEHFWNATFNTFGIFVVATVPQLLLALWLANTLNRTLRMRTFFRMGVLLPNITSVVAVTIIFAQFFSRDFGIVNWLLGQVGIDPLDWPTKSWSAWIGIATIVDWRWTGYMTLILLAGMQAIPRDLYEAAEIDGAGRVKQFWTITVPMLRPTLLFSVILATIGGIQLFAEPLLFDPGPSSHTGGAGRQYQTLALYMYEEGFRDFDFGYAAAISWVIFLIAVIASVINYLLVRRIRSAE